MKDSLKNFVDAHREDFDDQEPSAIAWHAIEGSLPRMKRLLLWNSMAVWRAAAVLFLGLSIYFFVTRDSAPVQRKEMAQLQGDFTDLELFYRNQITEKIGLINDYDVSGEGEQFTQDFQKLDAMYQVLREEMKKHASEKVKDALVLNLLIRIDLLNQQLKKLEDSRRKHTAKPAEV